MKMYLPKKPIKGGYDSSAFQVSICKYLTNSICSPTPLNRQFNALNSFFSLGHTIDACAFETTKPLPSQSLIFYSGFTTPSIHEDED